MTPSFSSFPPLFVTDGLGATAPLIPGVALGLAIFAGLTKSGTA